MRTILILLMGSALCLTAAAQKLPVLRSHTRSIDVRDGHNFYKAYWTATPEVRKDIYYAHRFSKTNTVTFYSDLDSVTFNVRPDRRYPFIILLDQKDSCYTEINTSRTSYFKDPGSGVITNDTIPFTLGRDNRVYLTGRVNGSRELKFFFDDGADNLILFPSALQKGVQVRFDDSIADRAGDVQMRKTGNADVLAIRKLRWRNEQVMYINKQIGEGDGTIGYDLFENKLIEIDYEKQRMIIHDKAFPPGKGYRRFPMQLQGGTVPFINATVINKGQQISADFLFDMGATGCLFLNSGFLKKNKLYGTMEVTGDARSTGGGDLVVRTTKAILPGFIFGGYPLKDMPVNLEDPAVHDPGTGTLGMDLMKRFNTILDYQHNVIWLKPNKLIRTPFKQAQK